MQYVRIFLILVIIFCMFAYIFFMRGESRCIPMRNRALTLEDIITLFPTTPEQIKKDKQRYIDDVKKTIAVYLSIPSSERTFENTVLVLDRVMCLSDLAIFRNALSVVEYLSPDAALRQEAHDAALELHKFFVEEIDLNKAVYDAFMAYVDGTAKTEVLTDDQQYLITETRRCAQKAGLGLPDAQRERVMELTKELAVLCADFDRNIAQDSSVIHVDRAGLVGLDDDFIATLSTTDDGMYSVGVDYPTFVRVMEQCAVEDTRKRLSQAFNNRAYPVNHALLVTIIAKSDELAHIVGFPSYAALDLDGQMVGNPERATTFLNDLYQRAGIKEERELARLTADLPASVTLTSDGKLKPWDISFLKACYKKKTFDIDEQLIAEYFPTEKTIQALLDIYQKFFSLTFKEVPVHGLWHDDVTAIQVYKKQDNKLIGTLLLDLHPRPNKYTHAAHLTVIRAVCNVDGTDIPDVSIVMANFPKSTPAKPSLLKRGDVQTFFHEFGHALHAILGCTELASFSGTSVKRDFVEMPSQMLEEWLWDKDMLRSVSSHYKTGELLPDDVLRSIVALKQFDSGMIVRAQVRYAMLALRYYADGQNKDPYAILVDVYTQMAPQFFFDPENHFYASFGHLTGYGAKYYGYLWSKVFALDLFAEIKKQGLLNPVIGRRYADTVLARGGSREPQRLLIEFLGREPRIDAFMKDLGL
jgi:thimet oligopeptidase